MTTFGRFNLKILLVFYRIGLTFSIKRFSLYIDEVSF